MMKIKKTLDQYIAFISYRYQAYTTELAQLLLQLKNFGTLFVIVLGSALLGVVLLLFLGFGKIIDSYDAPKYGAQMAWLYLLLQSVMLSAIKPAIKNAQGRYFQQTLVRPFWLKLVDFKLLLLSNIWLLGSVVIALDLNTTQWLKVPHFILFMLLQLLLGVLCLYKPKTLVYGFFLSLILLILPTTFSPFIYHSSFIVLFLLSCFIPAINISAQFQVKNVLSFWLLFFIEHSWAIVWRGALLLCVFMAANVLLQQRADLAAVFNVLTLAFFVLFCSSLQFDCHKLQQQYSQFFTLNNQARVFYISHFLPSTVLFIITTIGYLVFFEAVYVLAFFALIWCVLQQYLAQKKPAHYALVWMITLAITLAVNV